MRLLKATAVALLAVLLVAGGLWATDNTWKYLFPTLGGLSKGSLLYAYNDTGTVSNISAVASGQVLTSAGTNTAPAYSASPSLTSMSAKTFRVPGTSTPSCATNCGGTSSVTGSDSAGKILLGTAPSNAFILAFSGTWAAAPACTVQVASGATGLLTKATSTTTTLTVTTAGTAPGTNDIYSYLCVGVQ